jgi:hypothetical protein
MRGLSRILHGDWSAVRHIRKFGRSFRDRDAIGDARRAQASRFTLVQSGLPVEDHGTGTSNTVKRRTDFVAGMHF